MGSLNHLEAPFILIGLSWLILLLCAAWRWWRERRGE